MRFLMGSKYFFSCYDDFCPKDIDEIEIVDTEEFEYFSQLTGKDRCLFRFRRLPSAQDYIDCALQSHIGMVVGKFLIPEFCDEIGFNFSDLKQLKPLIDILDEKHQYEEIIYNSYLNNRGFFLTDEQRKEAYISYKTSRGE